MDLLKTILIYMSMVFAASVQNAPDPGALPAYDEPTPTPYVEMTPVPAAPTVTPRPTPVPTIDITPNPNYGNLRVGDSGDDVRQLQEKLAQYGYYEGEIDGVYGNQTRRAVEEFQYQHGLSSDGIAGRNTLTVLYESDEVRMAPSAVTPAPSATSSLSIAMTEAPTETPAASPVAQATPSATPSPSPTPSPAPTASPTPNPAFVAMEGYGIRVGESEELLTVEEGKGQALLPPYTAGGEMYLPLMEILHGAGINVISSQSLEMDEYAFVVNDDIYRITFTENQAGEPVSLEVYKNNEPQIVPLRDIRRAGDILYLPAATIESLTGIAAQTDETAGEVVVTIPEASENMNG